MLLAGAKGSLPHQYLVTWFILYNLIPQPFLGKTHEQLDESRSDMAELACRPPIQCVVWSCRVHRVFVLVYGWGYFWVMCVYKVKFEETYDPLLQTIAQRDSNQLVVPF